MTCSATAAAAAHHLVRGELLLHSCVGHGIGGGEGGGLRLLWLHRVFGSTYPRLESADERVLLTLLRVDGLPEPVVLDTTGGIVEASLDVFAVERVERFLDAFVVQEFEK